MAREDFWTAHVERSGFGAGHIDCLRAVEVTSFDEYDARAGPQDPFAGLAHVVHRSNRHVGEDLCFRDVWGDNVGDWQQLGGQRRDRIDVEKPVTPLRDHDRINHDLRQVERANGGGDGLDDRRCRQHAYLDRIRAEVTDDRFDLRRHEIGRERLPTDDPSGILRGHCRDCGRAKNSMRGERLQISLYSGASTRIAAGNRECCFHLFVTSAFVAESTCETDEPSIVQSPAMQNSMRLSDTLLANAVVGVRMGGAIRAAVVGLFVALTATAAQVSIPLPFTPVPLTLQPMVVLLSGAVLGSRLGMTAQVLYLVAGIVGLPVFAASPILPQGPLRLMGPTGGYLMAYPFAAFVAGWLAERGLDRRYVTSLLAMACGLAIIFFCGVLWLAFFARPAVGIDAALRTGLYPFVPLDIFKLLVAASITPAVWRLITNH